MQPLHQLTVRRRLATRQEQQVGGRSGAFGPQPQSPSQAASDAHREAAEAVKDGLQRRYAMWLAAQEVDVELDPNENRALDQVSWSARSC